MLEELTELLLGLAGAGIALAALYFFIAKVQQEESASDKPEPRVGQHQAVGLGGEAAPSVARGGALRRAPRRRLPSFTSAPRPGRQWCA